MDSQIRYIEDRILYNKSLTSCYDLDLGVGQMKRHFIEVNMCARYFQNLTRGSVDLELNEMYD